MLWLVVWNIFSHSVGNIIIPTDFHIFQSRYTTSYAGHISSSVKVSKNSTNSYHLRPRLMANEMGTEGFFVPLEIRHGDLIENQYCLVISNIG